MIDTPRKPLLPSFTCALTAAAVFSALHFDTMAQEPSKSDHKGPLTNRLAPLAKVDIDGDMNYDGTIDNSDPADNGDRQSRPPGLEIGVGELSKLVVRLKPYNHDYTGTLVLGFEMVGINRGVASGQFESFDEEVSSTARVRIWSDKNKSTLLLDSADPNRRYIEYTGDRREIAQGLPGGLPRFVYVEGVDISGEYPGDVQVRVTTFHRKPNSDKANRAATDAILLTVNVSPIRKSFVNANAEDVWVTPTSSK